MGLEAVTHPNDLNVSWPLSSDPRSEGDDHIRNIKTAIKNAFPGLAGRAWRVQTKASGYTLIATDNMSVVRASAAITISITAAATLENGYQVILEAVGGDVVVDPNASETVNGVSTVTLKQGQAGILLCDGSAFKLLLLPYVGADQIFDGTLKALGGVYFSGTVSPAQITANQNDYSPTGLSAASILRINSDARRNITGLAGGAAGRKMTVHNVGTFPILFKREDAGSTAANRFAFGCTLGGGQTMELEYDGTSSRWRAKSIPEAIGTLKDFAGTTVPEDFLACDGSAVSRSAYAALFNEIGTTHGVGDGSTTFNVPDSRRRTYVGSGGTGTGTLGNAVGNTGGAETHQLTIAEMPAHTHGSVQGSSPANSAGQNAASHNNRDYTTTGSTGGDGAHNNMQPSLVVTKMIRFA